MHYLTRPFGAIHVQIDGPDGAPTVVFANSLGTDLRLWHKVLPLLPQGLRFVRYDKRGHGLSGVDADSRDIADHISDAMAVIEAFGQRPVAFVGLSIGGLIAQGVAAQRPDLLRALVLSNTAAKLGSAQGWAERIASVQAGGCAAIADAVMARWFGPAFRQSAELPLWRNMLARTSGAGYIAACHALAGADHRVQTARITLPTLAIGGEVDASTPPGVVKETADLIAGATYAEIAGAGHLPCVEAPAAWAALVSPFLKAHLNV